ncbi:hypothetical protein SAMN05216174_102216 [Actinokineospora iranica]|uniref:Uncharacterized protein n=1 Tax=Actinokineospora iranica TaxID=1271860 RepID=A0A1G6LS69_9PSEU|nr:hypothetical protein SAMN05216174_102216 [Actinokineospora iranica]
MLTAGAALAMLALAACGQGADEATSGALGSTSAGAAPVAAGPTGPEESSTQPRPTEPQQAEPTESLPGKPLPSGPPVPTEAGPDYRPLPPAQVDAKALPDAYADRRVWVAPDGRSLHLFGVARDSCTLVEGRVIEESTTSVTVALNPMAQPQGGPDGGQMCAQVLTQRPVSVPLAVELGARTVVLVEGP